MADNSKTRLSPHGDPLRRHIVEAETIFEKMDRESIYELQYGDDAWQVVSMDDFIDAEAAAGFIRTLPGYGPATGGFGGMIDGVYVSGRVRLPEGWAD